MNDMEIIQTKFDGKRAIITGRKHPHKGCTATCMGAEVIKATGKYGMRFKREDTDEEFFVFDGSDVKWIEK